MTAAAQTAALAAQMRDCMRLDLDPRAVHLIDKDSDRIVGTRQRRERFTGVLGRRRTLAEALHYMSIAAPDVYRAAVEEVGGREWRAFEMRCLAKRRKPK